MSSWTGSSTLVGPNGQTQNLDIQLFMNVYTVQTWFNSICVYIITEGHMLYQYCLSYFPCLNFPLLLRSVCSQVSKSIAVSFQPWNEAIWSLPCLGRTHFHFVTWTGMYLSRWAQQRYHCLNSWKTIIIRRHWYKPVCALYIFLNLHRIWWPFMWFCTIF